MARKAVAPKVTTPKTVAPKVVDLDVGLEPTFEAQPEFVPIPEWVEPEEVPRSVVTRGIGRKTRNAADVIIRLENHMGRWLKIHREFTTPSELYFYNKDKGSTDAKLTTRGWAKASKVESDNSPGAFFYATIISGGLQGRAE